MSLKDRTPALAGLVGAEAQSLIGGMAVDAPMQTNDDLDWWEHRLEAAVETDTSLPPTERETIIRARRGPGAVQGTGYANRGTVPHHPSQQLRSSSGESL